MDTSIRDHLTECEKEAARLMGISEAEMFERLVKFESGEFDVTIIIPVYNCEKYISECVESAKNQTYKNIEIIVVNDGSTDGTHDIVKSIDGITYLIKPNGGTASALNCGIRNCHGRWIHWLSADDALYKNAVEDMMKYISTTPLNNKYIYYTHYEVIDSDGNPLRVFVEPEERNLRTKEERFSELLGNYYGNGSTSMIHRSVFDKIRYDEKLPHCEDYDFWLNAMKNDIDLKLIPIFTLKYRNHEGQMTNRVDYRVIEEIRKKYG